MVDLYGDVWRTGGSKSKTGDEMDDFLEARAAKIETDGQADSTTIGLNCLKGDFDAVFAMYPGPVCTIPSFATTNWNSRSRQMYAGYLRVATTS